MSPFRQANFGVMLSVIHIVLALLYSKHDQFSRLMAEARMFCGTVLRDIRFRQRLEQLYPGRILTVRYEQFAADLLNQVTDIYRFLGERLHSSIRAWASRKNAVRRKSPTRWREALTADQNRMFQGACAELMQELILDAEL